MKLKGRKIGVAITGSFCTYEKVFQALRAIKKGRGRAADHFFQMRHSL